MYVKVLNTQKEVLRNDNLKLISNLQNGEKPQNLIIAMECNLFRSWGITCHINNLANYFNIY